LQALLEHPSVLQLLCEGIVLPSLRMTHEEQQAALAGTAYEYIDGDATGSAVQCTAAITAAGGGGALEVDWDQARVRAQPYLDRAHQHDPSSQDSFSTRASAVRLLRALHRSSASVKTSVEAWVEAQSARALADYDRWRQQGEANEQASDEGWQQKCSTIGLVLALAHIDSEQENAQRQQQFGSSDVSGFFGEHLLPELQMQVQSLSAGLSITRTKGALFVSADALEFVATKAVSSRIPPAMMLQMMPLLTALVYPPPSSSQQHGGSPVVLHSYAAVAIEKFLAVKIAVEDGGAGQGGAAAEGRKRRRPRRQPAIDPHAFAPYLIPLLQAILGALLGGLPMSRTAKEGGSVAIYQNDDLMKTAMKALATSLQVTGAFDLSTHGEEKAYLNGLGKDGAAAAGLLQQFAELLGSINRAIRFSGSSNGSRNGPFVPSPLFCHYLFECMAVLVQAACASASSSTGADGSAAVQHFVGVLLPTFSDTLSLSTGTAGGGNTSGLAAEQLSPYVHQILAQLLQAECAACGGVGGMQGEQAPAQGGKPAAGPLADGWWRVWEVAIACIGLANGEHAHDGQRLFQLSSERRADVPGVLPLLCLLLRRDPHSHTALHIGMSMSRGALVLCIGRALILGSPPSADSSAFSGASPFVSEGFELLCTAAYYLPSSSLWTGADECRRESDAAALWGSLWREFLQHLQLQQNQHEQQQQQQQQAGAAGATLPFAFAKFRIGLVQLASVLVMVLGRQGQGASRVWEGASELRRIINTAIPAQPTQSPTASAFEMFTQQIWLPQAARVGDDSARKLVIVGLVRVLCDSTNALLSATPRVVPTTGMAPSTSVISTPSGWVALLGGAVHAIESYRENGPDGLGCSDEEEEQLAIEEFLISPTTAACSCAGFSRLHYAATMELSEQLHRDCKIHMGSLAHCAQCPLSATPAGTTSGEDEDGEFNFGQYLAESLRSFFGCGCGCRCSGVSPAQMQQFEASVQQALREMQAGGDSQCNYLELLQKYNAELRQ
jgi:hypothetical protein